MYSFFFYIIFLVVLPGVVAFKASSIRSRTHSTRSLAMGFKEQMEMRKAQRQAINREKRTVAELTEPVKTNSPTSTSASSKPRDGVPFSDDIYDKLQFVITTLTKRMKGKEVLSKNDLHQLENDINALLNDAGIGKGKGVGKDFDFDSMPMDLKAELGENNIFAQEFKGANSWRIPGMEKMSTDEYYRAIQQRIRRMKEQRQATGERTGGQSVDDYFAILNSKNRSTI
jgi:hypothetical protein